MDNGDLRVAAGEPRVSVIVRTRNRPEMLGTALADVTAQTFSDLEIVVVDDGDDPAPVADIVEAAGDSGVLIRIVDKTAETHGRARAANAGIRAANGRLLVIHDDDDAWKPTFLEETTHHLELHPECLGVSARTEIVVHRVDGEGRETSIDRGLFNQDLNAITIPDMMRANRITTNSFLYRASVHDEIGVYDEHLTVHEDWEFYLRFIMRYPIDLLPLPALAEWHHRPGSTGDAANSIFSLDTDHSSASLGLRDDQLRSSFLKDGSGPALHLAHEMQRLQDRADDDRAEQARATHQLLARIDDLSGQIAALEQVVLQRTSISSFARRASLLLRRR